MAGDLRLTPPRALDLIPTNVLVDELLSRHQVGILVLQDYKGDDHLSYEGKLGSIVGMASRVAVYFQEQVP